MWIVNFYCLIFSTYDLQRCRFSPQYWPLEYMTVRNERPIIYVSFVMCLMVPFVWGLNSLHLIQEHFQVWPDSVQVWCVWYINLKPQAPHFSMNNSFCPWSMHSSLSVRFSHVFLLYEHVILLHYGIILGNFPHVGKKKIGKAIPVTGHEGP
jgi:hypothetical protein